MTEKFLNLFGITEYVEAEFAAIAQQIAQLETAKTLEKLQKNADIHKDLKTAAKFENLNRFYELAAARWSKIFNKTITAGEVAADKTMDPLFGFRQNIAMATSNLRRMAHQGSLDDIDSEWDDVVDALAEEWEIQKRHPEDWTGMRDTPDVPDARYFAFLSYLIEKNKGTMWAATTYKAIQGRNKTIKGALGDRFVTFRQLIPEGYTTWKPGPQKGWFWANTIADNILQKILEGEKTLQEPDVKQMLAKGQDLVWVIPEGLAETLDTFRKFPEAHSLGKLADFNVKLWKQWVLINPRRVVKYNLNNMSGDLDITLAYAPAIASP